MRFPVWTVLSIFAVAAPVAAQEQVACWSYADSALHVVAEAARHNCGFTGGRWSTDYNAHYSFCMGLGPNGGYAVDTETNQRGRDLNACWAQQAGVAAFLPRTDFEDQNQQNVFPLTLLNYCQNYADTTSQQVQYNLRLGCGYLEDGGRWAQSYNFHRDACLGGFGGQNIGQIAASEISARYWAIKECQVGFATDQIPVEEPTPPPPVVDPAGATHVITSDVDLYDAPGQTVIGILQAGEEVRAACRADGWCEIEGRGWAWGEFVAAL